MRMLGLGGFLFTYWLALSGHYTPMLIGTGALSAVFCVWAMRRLHSLDAEGQPLSLLRGAVFYWPWLTLEILKSSFGVARIVLHPRLPISPALGPVRAGQKSAAGIATYANSITLTPGTLTVGVQGDQLLVHTLVKDGLDDLESGRMNARVNTFEGREGEE